MNLPRLTTLFVACLMALLAGVLRCPWIARADAAINGFFDPYRKQPLLDAFLWLTAFGAKPAIVAVCLTATGLFRIARMKGLTLPLWVAFLGGEATSWSLKHLVGRARPEFIEVASATSPSFPSGHSISAMTVYGFMAFVLFSHSRGGNLALVAPMTCAALIALVGLSRIFLSVHYASDVLGGFLVGAIWLLVAISLSTRISP